MGEYIVGLKDTPRALQAAANRSCRKAGKDAWLDLTQLPLDGVEVVDATPTASSSTASIRSSSTGWRCRSSRRCRWRPSASSRSRAWRKKNLTLDWYPVGTGPYMLTENNPNRGWCSSAIPNFRGEPYPAEGEPGDARSGAARRTPASRMPFIDKVVFSLEKESIPYWNKFLQGYYDAPASAPTRSTRRCRSSAQGESALTDEMQERGIALQTSSRPPLFYIGFNMLDPVVGGQLRARAQAAAGDLGRDRLRGVSSRSSPTAAASPAQGPIPPGIFGYRDGRGRHQPGTSTTGSDGRPRAQVDRAGAEAARRGGLPERHRRQDRPAAGALLRHDARAAPSGKSRARLAGASSSRRSTCSSWSATPTATASRTRCARATRRSSSSAGTPTIPIPENFLFLLHGPQSQR